MTVVRNQSFFSNIMTMQTPKKLNNSTGKVKVVCILPNHELAQQNKNSDN